MFNVMRYTEMLEASGFSKDQAATSLSVVVDIMNQNFVTNKTLKVTEFAIRADMQRFEVAIRSDMQKMELGIRSDMQKMEAGIRSDVQKMESGIRSDMNKTDANINELRSDVKILKNDIGTIADKIVIRLSGVIVALSAAVFGSIKIF